MKYTHKLPIREANKLGIHLGKASLCVFGNKYRLIGNEYVKITFDEALAYRMMVDHTTELRDKTA